MYSSYFIFVGKSEPIGYWINELLRETLNKGEFARLLIVVGSK